MHGLYITMINLQIDLTTKKKKLGLFVAMANMANIEEKNIDGTVNSTCHVEMDICCRYIYIYYVHLCTA